MNWEALLGVIRGTLRNAPWQRPELYNPAAGQRALTGSMNSAREYHAAPLLNSGETFVAGGLNSNNFALSSAELYDPATGHWNVTGSMNSARQSHTMTLLPNGDVVVAGASTPVIPAFSVRNSTIPPPASGQRPRSRRNLSEWSQHKPRCALRSVCRHLVSNR
jgi:hypothetical protein